MTNATVRLMLTLKAIDDAGMTTRDMLVLFALRSEPGLWGIQLSRKIGKTERSHIQGNIPRLVKLGYVEDRRPEPPPGRNSTPNQFYITEAGLKAFSDISSKF